MGYKTRLHKKKIRKETLKKINLRYEQLRNVPEL